MPITRGAKKANRASKKKATFNARRKDGMKAVVKKFKAMVAAGDKDGAAKLMPSLYKAIDKAKKRGVIKGNKASRDKSRISKLLTR
jgi:small subunit ribosomal protein S20